MVKKPIRIPLKDIHPTEYLIPEDKLEEIAAHYDGRVESIKPIRVVGKPGEYYPQNGNKRALFLSTKGSDYILGLVANPEDTRDDIEECQALAAQAEQHGVRSLDDLRQKIVDRAEYERLMNERDAKKQKR